MHGRVKEAGASAEPLRNVSVSLGLRRVATAGGGMFSRPSGTFRHLAATGRSDEGMRRTLCNQPARRLALSAYVLRAPFGGGGSFCCAGHAGSQTEPTNNEGTAPPPPKSKTLTLSATWTRWACWGDSPAVMSGAEIAPKSRLLPFSPSRDRRRSHVRPPILTHLWGMKEQLQLPKLPQHQRRLSWTLIVNQRVLVKQKYVK